MATESELAQSALAHAKKTSWSFDKWLAEIATNPAYLYKGTEWYKAGKDLNAAKTAGTPPPPSPGSGLADAQARMFLAQEPLDCLQAPSHMIPVCTADPGYQDYYTPDVISKLRERFALVEAWCDCRDEGTPYSMADQMVRNLQLDGQAWGQCENATEFDHAYEAGARRMIGQLAGLREDQKVRVNAEDVHLAFELYRNVMPWQVPDYQNCTGVAGNAIGVYASETEGAVYTPVATYKGLGYYVSGRDSVYAVGLHPEDWKAL